MGEQKVKEDFDINRKAKSTYIIFFIITFLYHIMIQPIVYDDVVNTNILNQYSIIDYNRFLYNEWTSRLIFSTVAAFLLKYPIVWKLIDTLIFASFPYLISKLVDASERGKILTCLLVLLYPFEDMKSAGWVTTTVNYLWPLWFALIACIIMKKYCLRRSLRWHEYIIGTISVILASNLEQIAAILFLLLIGAFVYMLSQERYKIWFFYLYLIMNIVSLWFIITCPGNYGRANDLISLNELQGYDKLTLMDKIFLGLTNIVRVFIATPNRLFLVFTIGIFAIVYIQYNELKKRMIAVLPSLVCLCYAIVGKAYPNFEFLFSPIEQSVVVDWLSAQTYIPLIQFLICASGVIYAIYLIARNRMWIFHCNIFVLGAGFASAMIVAFTASLYTSGTRIFLFLYFAFILTFILCYEQMNLSEKQKIQDKKLLIIGFVLWCGINVLYNICMCYAVGRLS